MKPIKDIKILTIILIVLLAGCSDDFLKEESKSELTTTTFFKNDAEAKLAVNGLYMLLHQDGLYRNVGLDRFYLMGGDEVGTNRAEDNETYNYTWNASTAYVYDTYKALYEVIRNADLFISSIEGNENVSESVQNQAIGEALFIRALMYWHLTNIWGDVPYFRELLSIDELSTIERTDKELIREEMRNDLDRAYNLLPASYPASDLGRATKWAATALKAKYFMMEENWAGTLAECKKLIQSPNHRLLDNFADVFDQKDSYNQYNDEIIFAVDFFGRDAIDDVFKQSRQNWYNPRIDKDEPLRRNEPGVSAAFKQALNERNEWMAGYGKMIPLPELARAENWEDGDLRYSETIIQEYLGFELQYPYFKKMWNLDQENHARHNSSVNYVVFRMADIYLMAAEAENELNGPGEAYEYVNAVRARAFNPDKPWSGLSKEEFRTKMYDERKFELCGEAYRKLDLWRWGILIETIRNTEQRPHNNPASNISEKHLKYPLPEEEIILNPNLLNTDATNNGWQ
ncbi:Starch-binding associating with outer membrane [Mariniphaga anaerophila]|uniref:Starch-binding associating with outer membrane n=1 Tax=Mariniphaga anaerophila TaxID=1484053 RepID=A0A1M4Y3G6_9BACT|nr:RagB/SusD family nutrient uptake outer membrane protein [Mariniphaga anaerophila]SHF00367.1 Starch-binding associating with outer membrane [Mariniphaga anaerophila]